MKDLLPVIIPILIATGIFIWLWRKGTFLALANYWHEMVQELKKCNWPTWEELWGHTVVVSIAVALLGVFTFIVDMVLTVVIQYII